MILQSENSLCFTNDSNLRLTGKSYSEQGRILCMYCYIVYFVGYCITNSGWQSGDRIPVGRDFPPVQTGPGAHPPSCTMGTGFFPGVKYARGVLLTTHPFYCRGHGRVELPTLWTTSRPVTGTLYLYLYCIINWHKLNCV